MLRTQNNDDLSMLTTVPVYIGTKSFLCSLVFMGVQAQDKSLTLRARIYLYGSSEVYYDSEDTEVCIENHKKYSVNFKSNCFERVVIDPNSARSYEGVLEKDCTVHFYVKQINGMYVIEVRDVEIPIKWVIGARHIVMVDPKFHMKEESRTYTLEVV